MELHYVAEDLTSGARVADLSAQASHLAAVRLRLWQAASCLHDAFHATPSSPTAGAGRRFGICRRHLAASTLARLRTTRGQLHDPIHGHTTHPDPTTGETG
ncbi:hypothetical protein EBN88_00495 [Streptomyces triticirhizae]|uniref:CHAD domain-containing protein n=1 Tax=Streptomyces triticirhizae TaxID=2483353 RepID=A0A3M2MDM3_9ACTN|nr:hypothetical protein EBN88_00495 [Streptomyces triticirhizae]